MIFDFVEFPVDSNQETQSILGIIHFVRTQNFSKK